MRIRSALRQLSRASVFAFLFCSTGCGLLGQKESKAKTTKLNQSTGCLDQLGPIFTLYLHGDITPSEWVGTWDCVDNTLGTLTRYVQGATPGVYSPTEIKSLVENFILTGKPITAEMIQGLFAIKATLIGGRPDRITLSEIATFRSLAQFVKERSVALIPMLYNFQHAKTRANLDQLATALNDFSGALADELPITNHAPLTKASITSFITELSKTSIDFDASDLQTWIDFFFGAKGVVIGGEETSLSGTDILSALHTAGDLGANILTMNSDDANADSPALLRVIDSLERNLLATVARGDGQIPFATLENLFNLVPKRFLPKRADEFRAGIIHLLHPRTEYDANGKNPTRIQSSIATLLKNLDPAKDGAIFANNVSELVAQLRLYVQSERTLSQVYAGLGKELSVTEFTTRIHAMAKAGQLDYPDSVEIERLVALAGRYPGLFAEGSSAMRFNGVTTLSKTTLSRYNWMERASRRLLEGYGTAKGTNGDPIGTGRDLKHLVLDVDALLRSVGLVHPLTVDVDKKRFREANLFMSTSNGDNFLDINEVTEYINTLVASSNLGSRMSKLILGNEDQPGLCAPTGFDPLLQLPTYDITCFRREYRAHFAEFFRDYPFLMDTFIRASGDDQDQFFQRLEAASRFDGLSEKPITDFDISSYSGIAHYVELVMYRFDRNGGRPDNGLDRSEIIDQIFPIFSNELTKVTCKDTKILNQALLLYLTQYGRSPFADNNHPTVGEYASLVLWVLNGGPFNNFLADRLRIYAIFGTLSAAGGTACPNTAAATVSSASVKYSTSLHDDPEPWLTQSERTEGDPTPDH